MKKKETILETLYEVAYLISRSKAPYTSGDKLIKTASLKMSQVVLGEEAAGKLERCVIIK